MISRPGDRIPDEVAAEWARVDQENTRWLGELLATRGWPGETLVGRDGATAAWLLAQHADHDPVLHRRFLEALRDAVAQGEASPANLAYLEDRVRVHDGRPQLYGTQFTLIDGELCPEPIEDPEHLDERRAQVGLGPFADYEARMRANRGLPGSHCSRTPAALSGAREGEKTRRHFRLRPGRPE
jgi:hypothetical protein